ncbi:hypothetical protein Pyrde_1829 [Pyrodictium delaneyi]|uniref:Uncharacterized protein n=1 Tax=Pyrodictium delaneyi TaxID=1273541 RepID=A0A0P0N6E0_9CREN|nr:hypothetical protein [Pyrodictium delaneyi]ALL01872.1 hypothetical protein Pyrde_1829 [Pyrodictium delaneyi]
MPRGFWTSCLRGYKASTIVVLLNGVALALPRPEDLVRMAGLGRFQVMALLQAARYYKLKGDLERAKSWGLNRAIFYAWAKYYGPRGWRRAARLDELLRRGAHVAREGRRCPEGMVEELGECVVVGRRGWYALGGEEQTPRDFDREVTLRVSKLIPWEQAWKAALEYVSLFPEWVLRDPQRFYKLVYEPVRDTFFLSLLRGEKPRPPRSILERLESLERMAGKAGKQTGLDAFMKTEAMNKKRDDRGVENS